MVVEVDVSLSITQKQRIRSGGRHIGKVRYGHLETALKACEKMAKRGKDGLTPYRCPMCNGYHIGHTPNFLTLTITRS